jgi:hypothetical protein
MRKIFKGKILMINSDYPYRLYVITVLSKINVLNLTKSKKIN